MWTHSLLIRPLASHSSIPTMVPGPEFGIWTYIFKWRNWGAERLVNLSQSYTEATDRTRTPSLRRPAPPSFSFLGSTSFLVFFCGMIQGWSPEPLQGPDISLPLPDGAGVVNGHSLQAILSSRLCLSSASILYPVSSRRFLSFQSSSWGVSKAGLCPLGRHLLLCRQRATGLRAGENPWRPFLLCLLPWQQAAGVGTSAGSLARRWLGLGAPTSHHDLVLRQAQTVASFFSEVKAINIFFSKLENEWLLFTENAKKMNVLMYCYFCGCTYI